MTDQGKILDRHLSRAATHEFRTVAGRCLREVIDYGLEAWERCSASASGVDTPIGILFPSLHCFEMLDATEVLLDHAAVAPANVTLRSAFEAALYCEYVATDDSERRGAAYVVTEVHRRLDRLDQFDGTTDRGKQFVASIVKDRVGEEITVPTIDNLEERREGLRSVLARSHLVDAENEYERTKAAGGRNPAFHRLWDGPATIEQLASKLNRSGQYDVLYRQWARTSHANDLGRQLRAVDGSPAVARFRNGEGMKSSYELAISIGIGVIQQLLSKYRHGELERSFRNWYLETIKPDFDRISPNLDPDPTAP